MDRGCLKLENSKREVSLERAQELKSRIDEFLKVRDGIPKGLEMKDTIRQRKEKIKEVLGATEEQWKDYRWQIENRITDVEILGKILNLTDMEKKEIKVVGKKFRWAVSP